MHRASSEEQRLGSLCICIVGPDLEYLDATNSLKLWANIKFVGKKVNIKATKNDREWRNPRLLRL